MKQQYFPYTQWEDYINGMWRTVTKSEETEYLTKAIEFTGNAELYGYWMMKVIQEWPIACMQNLTDKGINQRAWIGHAACCLAIKCPEYITRMAWGNLTELQKTQANYQADLAIYRWNHPIKQKWF